jgi:hypothetical protein
MEWKPQDEPLRQLSGYLRDSLNGYRAVQKEAEQVKSHPYHLMSSLDGWAPVNYSFPLFTP